MMTNDQFREAVQHDRPVRLKDRRQCFYQDEWYEPYLDGAGNRRMRCHTGEHLDVDDELLDQLTTEVEPLTVDRLVELAGDPNELPVVLEDRRTGQLTKVGRYEAEVAMATGSGNRLRRAATGEWGSLVLVIGCRPDGPTVD